MTDKVQLEMKPEPGSIDLARTALLMIDMQRDFLQGDGFAAMLGNDVRLVQRAIEPCKAVLAAARENGKILIIHTREGHRPEMVDVYNHKNRNNIIGSQGQMGKILIRGERGHDIIDELYPIKGEAVIDKPGKGSFYATDFELILNRNAISTLLVCGVTTEVCVHTTVREANDRGYHCIVVEDACASYNDEFHRVAIAMISAQGGIFGSVTTSEELINYIQKSSVGDA